ncbi:hypothetical protein MLD38_036995 [Melastoma candidum]|uniref:Uncharacterized protein n=1 Tax=Melastoma candidum TaxID=119954 RepID=A0ACB9LKQ7_9MYRT|nr:hypothetical protein MLD38_036995 [Melastoma candidum]
MDDAVGLGARHRGTPRRSGLTCSPLGSGASEEIQDGGGSAAGFVGVDSGVHRCRAGCRRRRFWKHPGRQVWPLPVLDTPGESRLLLLVPEVSEDGRLGGKEGASLVGAGSENAGKGRVWPLLLLWTPGEGGFVAATVLKEGGRLVVEDFGGAQERRSLGRETETSQGVGEAGGCRRRSWSHHQRLMSLPPCPGKLKPAPTRGRRLEDDRMVVEVPGLFIGVKKEADLEEHPQSPVGVLVRLVNRSLVTSLGIGNGSRLDYG